MFSNVVVYCFDARYANYCAVSILSLIELNKDLKIYGLFDESVTKNDLSAIEALDSRNGSEIVTIGVDTSQITHLQTFAHISSAAYIRMMIPEYLRDINTVLYLDCDLIVAKNISSLFNVDMRNYSFAGTYAPQGELQTRIPINKKGSYINSGVLLMNLEKLRKDNFFEKSMELYSAHHRDFKFADQCLINLYAINSKLILNETYNYRIWCDAINQQKWDGVRDKMHIFHFVGSKKPWHNTAPPFLFNYWASYPKKLQEIINTQINFKKFI